MIFTLLVFGLGIIIFPLIVLTLPKNFFYDQICNKEKRDSSLTVKVAKNFIGLILLFLGLIMLITPGQGLLSILLGLFLMDLPYKQKFFEYLTKKEKFVTKIDSFRMRFGREKFNWPK